MESNKLLNNPTVIDLLAEIGGANSVDLAEVLALENELDEFSIAERLGMDVKMVRKILYKLYDKRLVRFKRIKDPATGWYIYLWKFDWERLKSLIEKRRREKIRELRKKLEYEKQHQFFVCENGCVRVTFEEAMEHGFVCPYCGGKLVFYDNSKIIAQLEEHLKALERGIGY